MQSPAFISGKPQEASCLACTSHKLRYFCDLSPVALADLDALGEVFHHPRGVLLFREGNAPQAVYILCSGQVKLFCSSEEGKILILKLASAGDLLGLSAAIAEEPYEASAETLEPTQIKRIRQQDFLSFLDRHGECSRRAAFVIAQDYRAVLADARRLALSGSAAGKVAHILLEWGRTSSCDHPARHENNHPLQFTMPLTHEDLASIAGTSRETVTRLLGQFRRDGIITMHGSTLTICKPQKLQSLIA